MLLAYDGIESFKPILGQNAMNVFNPKTSQLSHPLIVVHEMSVLVIIWLTVVSGSLLPNVQREYHIVR